MHVTLPHCLCWPKKFSMGVLAKLVAFTSSSVESAKSNNVIVAKGLYIQYYLVLDINI